jgi:MFS family permease
MLATLRLFQGIGIGGEQGAGATWVIEAAAVAKSKRRGFWAGWVELGVPFGNVTGSLLTAFLVGLGGVFYFSYGWRIPFLVGAVVAVVGGFARFKLLESPLFVRIREEHKLVRNPPWTVIREKWKKMLPLTCINFPLVSGTGVMITPYTVLFLISTHVDRAFAAGAGIYYGIGECTTTLVAAALCDYVGRKPFALLCALTGVVFSFPFFMAMGAAATAGNRMLMILLLLGWGFGTGLVSGPLPAIYAESFETKYRMSGAGLSWQLGGLVMGVVTAFVVSPIIAAGSASVDQVWPYVAGINVVMCSFGVIGSLLYKETKNAEM